MTGCRWAGLALGLCLLGCVAGPAERGVSSGPAGRPSSPRPPATRARIPGATPTPADGARRDLYPADGASLDAAASRSSSLALVLDDFLRRWETFGFSGAVLLARSGEVLLSAGYGLADRKREVAATAETLFDVGSVSKQFTATAILVLAEREELEIEASIAAVLDDVPGDKRSITVHHLLTHTSGVSDFGRERATESRAELVASWLAQPLAAPPGTSYEYSNLGYSVLAAIVEVVSGRAFEDFLREALFAPAGMTSTALSWERPERWAGRTVALGYGGFTDPCGGEDPRDRPDGWGLRGSGNVLSSVEDLWRWERALRSGEILGTEWLARLDRPYTVAEADFLSYGYGWRLQESPRRTRVVWHSGLDGAFSALYRRYVDEDLVVIFLSNGSFDGVPARDLLMRPAREGAIGNLLFGGPLVLPPRHRAAVPALSTASAWTGPGGTLWSLERREQGLRLRAEDQTALEVLFPPANEEGGELSAAATRRAEEVTRALLSGDLATAAAAAAPVDPLGYSGRDLATAREQWTARERELGPLRAIDVVASTWVRHGPPERQVTHLRLDYERGTVDEHFLWYAEDEVYLIPCAPESTTLPLRALDERTLVGFDPLSGEAWTVTLDPDGRRLELAPWNR